MTTATFDWGRPGKPEHGVVIVKACHLSVSGCVNRGHLPLEKVSCASVGPPCVSVIRVSLQLDLPSVGPGTGPPPGVSGIRIHVSLRLDLPGLRRDLLGAATLRV